MRCADSVLTARGWLQSAREESDSKIRALLTPEQQKKFDTLLAEQKSRWQSRCRSGRNALDRATARTSNGHSGSPASLG